MKHPQLHVVVGAVRLEYVGFHAARVRLHVDKRGEALNAVLAGDVADLVAVHLQELDLVPVHLPHVSHEPVPVSLEVVAPEAVLHVKVNEHMLVGKSGRDARPFAATGRAWLELTGYELFELCTTFHSDTFRVLPPVGRHTAAPGPNESYRE